MSKILEPSDGQGKEYLAGDVVDTYMESATQVEVRGDASTLEPDNGLCASTGPACK